MALLPRQLNNRMILLVAIVLCVTGILSGWVTATRQSSRLIAAMQEHSSVMVRHFAENCARFLILQDYAELESFLLRSAELPSVVRLQVCEPDGRIVGDVSRGAEGKLISAPGEKRITPPVALDPAHAIAGGNLTYWYPIKGGNLLGWIRADFSMAPIKQARHESWQQSLLLAMFWVMGSAILILLALRPTAIALEKLTHFARELNECKGNRISVAHPVVEIEALEESLNYASGKLLSTEQQLLADQERLRKSEESYRQLLDTIQEGIWVIDQDSVTTFVNPRMAEILGYPPEEMLGKHLFNFMDAQGKAVAEANVERRKQGVREQHDFEFIRKDGRRICTRLETGPFFAEDGRYVGSIAAIADITERRNAELQLHASEQAFRAVVENSPDVIVRYDREGRLIYVNPEFERVNRLTAVQVLGKKPVELAIELSPMAAVFTEKLMEAMDSGTVTKIDLSWTKENTPICWYVRVVPEFDASGTVVSALTIWNDISERKQTAEEIIRLNKGLEQRVEARTRDLQAKRAELEDSQKALMNIVDDLNEKSEALEQANMKLMELDRLKSMFIASMSHELRTPLNSIIGFSSILRDEWLGPVNPEQKENLDTIQRSGKHLLSLINDVIDVSKIEAGKIDARFEEFDLYDLLTEAVQYVAKDLRDKGLELQLNSDHYPMRTDQRRLLQCVINLVSNAVKFTLQGGITITATLVTNASDEQRAVGMSARLIDIIIADTGIGIAAEEISKIFEPFVRLESPLKAAVSGTGLGLYLTRKLVSEVLHGVVFCTSSIGGGSTFTLRIPERIDEKSPGSRG